MPVLWHVLLAALFVSVSVYGVAGRMNEFIDGLAWFLLLMLFLWETRRQAPVPEPLRLLIHGLRGLCAVVVLWAAIRYWREGEWLDAANASLWLAVVALLEAEVLWPQAVGRHRLFLTAIAGALYGGLALFVLLWLFRGEWLDACDGALWLLAFFLIERDALRGAHPT